MQSKQIQEMVQKLSEGLADAGKLIEGGFAGFRSMVIPLEAPSNQVHEMRMAFFAGAQHLFASLMAVMDSDREPTPQDFQRMTLIQEELEAFRKDFEMRHVPVDGRA